MAISTEDSPSSVIWPPPSVTFRSPDVLNCQCGGRRTVVAVVTDAGSARTLLDGLGLSHRPPVFAPRGPPELFDDPSPAFEPDPPAPDP